MESVSAKSELESVSTKSKLESVSTKSKSKVSAQSQLCQRRVKSVSTNSKHTVTQANGISCLVRQEVVALCKADDTDIGGDEPETVGDSKLNARMLNPRMYVYISK